MKPAPFDYHAPTSVEEAVGLLSSLGDSAKLLAGGQSLVPMLALRLAIFEHLVDLAPGGGAAGNRASQRHAVDRRRHDAGSHRGFR